MVQDVVEMQIQAAKFLFTISITRPAGIMRFTFFSNRIALRISLRLRMYLSCHFLPSPLNIPLFHLSISLTVIF